MNKKTGFTIIELIVVIFIITIVITGGLGMIASFQKIREKENINNAIYEVVDTLSYAKAYCRKNSREGVVGINTKEDFIDFSFDRYNYKFKKVYMPKDIKLVSNFTSGTKIKISKDGYINNSGSIEVRYKKKTVATITVSVGNDIINIK